MTEAGWYPDPDGQPQTYRYWDGNYWSQATTGDPYAPPPPSYGSVPPAAPPAPPAALTPTQGVGGFPPLPPPGPSGPGGSRLTVLLVVVAVLAFVGLSIGGFVAYRVLADDDGEDTASDRTSRTEPVTTEPTGTTDTTEPSFPTTPTDVSSPRGSDFAVPTPQQCTGGDPTPSVTPGTDSTSISSGAVSIPIPEGYSANMAYSDDFTWADDFTPLQKVIEEGNNTGWVSIYGVGTLDRANGFDDLAQAADVVMACMAASSELYSFFTGRDDLSSGPITVDGYDAFQVTAELRVEDPSLSVEGDVAQVVVIDLGDPDAYGLYLTVVPIGDRKLIREQEAFVDQITVG